MSDGDYSWARMPDTDLDAFRANLATAGWDSPELAAILANPDLIVDVAMAPRKRPVTALEAGLEIMRKIPKTASDVRKLGHRSTAPLWDASAALAPPRRRVPIPPPAAAEDDASAML
ncbi:hypothetical protein AMAG_09448 [Allomyces macrogynus ATCC 38327]|uniref:Uncharacterized protein n=1 Tax=Allomyces macrogynus (strain ATCC 38327) TaxID=578462 RepID=A0A0L0SPH7_ALLM3|nr:hypothetical protein AMAG_09448 [Allomyces macrogynus ATCC 38327]|eukprot:KNE64426.1 hypothetical protein AMAG_09448 [Allomyces macrogynus ATCC 38327]